MKCLQEQGYPSMEFQSAEIRDDGLYSLTCNKGHTVTTVIQEQKFEILFDFGAMALIDGYFREAITSIAAALERFYEFYITATCLKHEIDLTKFQDTWRHVSSQSERQFGAYLFTYLIDHNGETPPIIDNERPDIDGFTKKNIKTWKEFRNAVVHKGYIPSIAETLAYGNIVYSHLNNLISDLKNRSSDAVKKLTFYHISRAHEIANGQSIVTMSIPTIISLASGEMPPNSLEESLKKLERYKKRLHYT